MRLRRRLGVLVIAFGMVVLTLPSPPVEAATFAVTVGDDFFEPKSVTVKVGDTVRWSLAAAARRPHNVQFDDGSTPRSQDPMLPVLPFERTFNQEGTYRYFCRYHGAAGGVGMSGVVEVTAGAPPPAAVVSTFYFAEGTVRDGFHEFITLQNPGDVEARTQLLFQASDDAGMTVTIAPLNVALPAASRHTVDVNDYVRGLVSPPVNVSVQVTSEQPIVAERPLYFNTGLAGGVNGGTDVIGAKEPATTFNFAEGTVRDGFQEFLTVQNPLTATAAVTVAFQVSDDTGAPVAVPDLSSSVPATSRVTLDINDHVRKTTSQPVNVSLAVKSDTKIVAERPLYFRTGLAGGVDGGTTVVGLPQAVQTYYFAEGTVRDGFVEFITLQNPGTVATTARLQFQAADDGGTSIPVDELTVSLPAASRRTVNVNEYLASESISPPINISVQVSADKPIVAERPLYFNVALAGGTDGGTDVIGAKEPALAYGFAEGTVRDGFHQFFTFQNPLTASANVTVEFQASDDAGNAVTIPDLAVPVAGTSRVTSDINEHVRKTTPDPVNISAKVTSDQKIVVERPLYFRTDLAGGVNGATTVIGLT